MTAPNPEHVQMLRDYYTRASYVWTDFERAQGDPAQPMELATVFEAAHRLTVFYGLLHVLVEGFRELHFSDPAIDGLLADETRGALLRRFRNAAFHFQTDQQFFRTKKVLSMIRNKGGRAWAFALWHAFGAFFERENSAPKGPAELLERIRAIPLALLEDEAIVGSAFISPGPRPPTKS